MNIVVIVKCQRNLFDIVLALSPTGRFTGLLHCREQQRNENRNDRDHNQQLNQSKTSTLHDKPP
jgi:hypothetical protein